MAIIGALMIFWWYNIIMTKSGWFVIILKKFDHKMIAGLIKISQSSKALRSKGFMSSI